jgi:hypothetical protein
MIDLGSFQIQLPLFPTCLVTYRLHHPHLGLDGMSRPKTSPPAGALVGYANSFLASFCRFSSATKSLLHSGCYKVEGGYGSVGGSEGLK